MPKRTVITIEVDRPLPADPQWENAFMEWVESVPLETVEIIEIEDSESDTVGGNRWVFVFEE